MEWLIFLAIAAIGVWAYLTSGCRRDPVEHVERIVEQDLPVMLKRQAD